MKMVNWHFREVNILVLDKYFTSEEFLVRPVPSSIREPHIIRCIGLIILLYAFVLKNKKCLHFKNHGIG